MIPFFLRDGIGSPDQELGGGCGGLHAPAFNGHHVEMILHQRASVIQGSGSGLVDQSRVEGETQVAVPTRSITSQPMSPVRVCPLESVTTWNTADDVPPL